MSAALAAGGGRAAVAVVGAVAGDKVVEVGPHDGLGLAPGLAVLGDVGDAAPAARGDW